MFETIKGVIGDLASGSIKDQRIALSQEQLAALDFKLRDALAEATVLRQRAVESEAEKATLRQRVAELEAANADLQAQLAAVQPTVAVPRSQRDPCPHCSQPRGKQRTVRPDRRRRGVVIESYYCEGCGETYQRESHHS